MVKIVKFFGYVTFFLLALMYFTPKESVYYFAENELKNFKVIVSNEVVMDKGFTLELKNMDVYVASIESAKINEMQVALFGLYNKVEAKDIELSSVAASFVPLKISDVTLVYTVINPLHIELNAVGEFGEAHGVVNVLDKNLSLILKPSKLMRTSYRKTLRNLRKKADGEYEYVQNF
ncbi:hypothetical protein [Sulfurimonas sp.]|uniref:hypothetical protein n=1 Tax=Sulfurimonas sp. TaxID=2022749 RepID=UPI00262074D7|nr:hypothetical protein [Sulfurimonas sp.]